MEIRYTTAHTQQGDREHVEDIVSIHEINDLTCFAVFNGHAGEGAAFFAAENIWKLLKEDERLISGRDPETVKSAIRDAFRDANNKFFYFLLGMVLLLCSSSLNKITSTITTTI